MESPRNNQAPRVNSWYTDCDVCYSSNRVIRPTATPTPSVTVTKTATSTPSFRLRLAKSCCTSEYTYVNASEYLPVGTIATGETGCYELFESLAVGAFFGFEYVVQTNFNNCYTCT